MKEKKQFRLYDIYRNACTAYKSSIRGIEDYKATIQLDGAIKLDIKFNDNSEWAGYYDDENKLKIVVRNVNKHLGNCRKPGKKKKTEIK